MAVRPHQDQRALVEFAHLRRRQCLDPQRHAGFGEGLNDSISRRRVVAEPQQHKTLAEEIERRAALADPRMRRTRSWTCNLRVGLAFERRRRRAIRPDDRRRVVAIAEVIAVHEPLVPHQLGVPRSILGARRVARRSGLEHLRRRLVGGARRQHAFEIVGRRLDVAHRHRLALDLIGREQVRPAPAFEHRVELPAEIDRVLHAGVHAERASRRREMDGVAGHVDAPAAVALGDELAPHPAQHRKDLVVEVLAHRAAQRRADVIFAMRHLLRRADDRHAEAVAAVDRDDRQPGAFRPDEDEAIAAPLIVQ